MTFYGCQESVDVIQSFYLTIHSFYVRYFEDVTDKAGVNMDSVWNFMRTTFTGGTHVLGGSFTVRLVST